MRGRHGGRVTSSTVGVLRMETGLEIVGPDGVRLVADVVRPADGGANPAVVMRTPYDRTTAASRSLQVDALGLAEAGYAVVLQDVRGRYSSQGEFTPFVNEGGDGAATIEWIAGQSWCNGRVGMAGISYNAYCQLAAAVLDPGPLGAWVPGLGPFDVRDSWVRSGGVLNLGFHLAWALGKMLPADHRVEDPERLLALADDPIAAARGGLDASPLSSLPAAAWLRSWSEQTDPYAGDPRVPNRESITAVSAPPLVVAGWYDVFACGAIEMASARPDLSAIVVGPWDHSGLPLARRVGDRDFGRSSQMSLPVLQREWFDLHLRGEGSRPSAARVFVTGIDGWETFDTWPPPSVPTVFHPQPNGDLSDSSASHGEVDIEVTLEDPTPAIGGRVYPWEPVLRSGPLDQRLREGRRDVHHFTTEPLRSPRRMIGAASASVHVAATTERQVFLTVVDVHPDGSSWNVAEGVGRAGAGGDVLSVSLGYLGHEFGTGHHIGVDISGAAWPCFPVSPGSRLVYLPGTSITLPQLAG